MLDRVLRAFIANGDAVLYAVSSASLVEQARQTHGLSPLATAALGRLLTGGILMAQTLKDEHESLSVTVNGGGPIGNCVVVAHGFHTVKGYVDAPHTDLPPKPNGKLDVGGAVGRDGFITVVKSMGLKDPYVGRTQLISGEIAEDISNYYFQSEQHPNAVALGVKVAPHGRVLAAGGLAVMPLPGCSEEVLVRLEEQMRALSNLSAVLERYESLEQAVEAELAPSGMQILRRDTPRFACDCSEAKLRGVIVSLGREEVNRILCEQGKVELRCHFCNAGYCFNEQRINEIFTEAEK